MTENINKQPPEEDYYDNSTNWWQRDLGTGEIDLIPHTLHDYVDSEGNRYTLNEKTGEYEVTSTVANDD